MRVRGASGVGRARGMRELMKKEQEEKKRSLFPCCTSRGRRKGNSVAQNDTVLFLPSSFLT